MPRRNRRAREDRDAEDLIDDEEQPPTIEPYTVLGIEKSATADEIKSAYRKAALKHHPDKAPEHRKDEAHTKFQEVAFAYAVLSDPVRRKRYDATGSTSESVDMDDGFSWAEFYSEQFRDVITADSIEVFSRGYKGSDEEKDDLLNAYTRFKGKWSGIYETVILSDPLKDEERFRGIIDEAIKEGEVKVYSLYTNETEKQKATRMRAANRDGKAAMAHAKKIGVYDKLFGKGEDGESDGESALAAMIQKRQVDRGSFLDNLEARYAAESRKPQGKKGKKRQPTWGSNIANSTPPGFLTYITPIDHAMTSGTCNPPIYPDYCHELSPTIKRWCPLRATDIYALDWWEMFNNGLLSLGWFLGRPVYHHGNHPVKWVRVTGVIVAVDEFYGRKVVTLDDSSGMCIECTCPAPVPQAATVSSDTAARPTVVVTRNQAAAVAQQTEGPTVANPKIPWDDVDVGVVVKIKGAVKDFREDERQVEIIKVEVLRSTDQEVSCWDEVLAFRREVLGVPWVVSVEMEEKYKRRAMREKKHEKKGKTEDGKRQKSSTEKLRGKPDMRQPRSAAAQDVRAGRRRETRTEEQGGKLENKHKRTVEGAIHEVSDGLRREKAKRRKEDGLDPANKANYPSLAVRRRVAGKYDALGI
ncbi:putative J domain-containing protein [Lachnellula hyalina]|uniref:Putative J domain-containing protein n=1 Tax=Lachnellula hyalina TaxID=1316788 RepID=A0A8H8R388_9HELO|nr:putative J domain-containing protein [Lachnellula hyalina]TVY27633.1 putative J domain-containing protein [Lachnellula hyalina]